MTKGQIITLFKRKYGKMIPSTNGWYRFNSPLDDSKDTGAAVHFDYRIVKDFRNIVGYISCFEFVKRTSGTGFRELEGIISNLRESTLKSTEYKSNENQKVELPEGYSNIFTQSKEGASARTYLKSRGITAERAMELGIGFCIKSPFFRRIVVPYYVDGVLIYFQTRSYQDSFFMKHKNPKINKKGWLYNHDVINYEPSVRICEGVFDAIPQGNNAVANGSWYLSPALIDKLILSKTEEFIYCTDSNPDGDMLKFYKKSADMLKRLARQKRVKVLDPRMYPSGCKDMNNIAVDHGISVIDSIINQTPLFNYTKIKFAR